MIATLLMLCFVSAAVVTDLRSRKIYNWTTYPGILTAIALGGLVSIGQGRSAVTALLGTTDLKESLLGLLACGGCMLVCYVFFSIGGGDVKLMAMLGAFLGRHQGFEVLLWTFVIGGAVGVIILVWRVGALRLLRRLWQYLVAAIRLRGFSHLRGGLGPEAQTSLHLAPSALAAVVLVCFDLPGKFRLL